MRIFFFFLFLTGSLNSDAKAYQFTFLASNNNPTPFKIVEHAANFEATVSLPSGQKIHLDLPITRNREYFYVYDGSKNGEIKFEFRSAFADDSVGYVKVELVKNTEQTELHALQLFSKVAESFPIKNSNNKSLMDYWLGESFRLTNSTDLKHTILLNRILLAVSNNQSKKAEILLNDFDKHGLSQADLGWKFRVQAKVYLEQGRMRDSLSYGYKGVNAWRKAAYNNSDLTVEIGQSLAETCNAGIFLGDPKTLDCLSNALDYAKNYPHLRALILNNIGGYYIENFDNRSALIKFEEAAQLYNLTRDTVSAAQAIYNTAYIYLRRGHFNKAVDRYYQSLNMLRETNDDNLNVYVLNRIGSIHLLLGDHLKADYYLRKAQSLLRDETQMRISANIAKNVGIVEYRKGNFAEALKHHKVFLNYHDKLNSGANSHKALARMNIAKTLQQLGRIEEAKKVSREALRLKLSEKTHADVLLNSAQLMISDSDLNKLRNNANKALEFYRQSHHYVEAVEAASLIADSYRAEKSWVLAIEFGRKALKFAEKAAMGFQDISVGREYLSRVHHIFSTLVTSFVQHYRATNLSSSLEQAFLTAEQGRAFYLRRIVETNKRDQTDRAKELMQQLVELNNRFLESSEAGNVDQTDRIRIQIDSVKHQYEIENRTANQVDFLYADTVNGLQEEMEKGSLYISFVLTDEVNYGFKFGRGILEVFDLPAPDILKPSVDNVLNIIKGGDKVEFDLKALKELGWFLLGKHIQNEDIQHLIVAPDGYLHYFPFSALDIAPNETHYHPVIKRYSLNLTPALRLNRPQSYFPWRSITIVVAESNDTLQVPERSSDVFRSWSRNLSKLPWALNEAKHIENIFGPSETLILSNRQANLEYLKSSTGLEADILHFASHGYISDTDPDFVGLVLSQAKKLAPEFVSWQQFAQLDIKARLVVLNACDTGLGRKLNGEGLLGLSYGFISAGAQETLTTLWKIADRPASDLMKAFYTELKFGESTATALRKAQLNLSRTRRHPFYWSGYVVHVAGQ